jgi:hypothetical protein
MPKCVNNAPKNDILTHPVSYQADTRFFSPERRAKTRAGTALCGNAGRCAEFMAEYLTARRKTAPFCAEIRIGDGIFGGFRTKNVRKSRRNPNRAARVFSEKPLYS